jgi:hypothetical protein
MRSVLAAYEADVEAFGGLAERTKADDIGKLRLIERSFGDFPLGALSAKQTRGAFKSWRNELALKSKRQADYAWSVLESRIGLGARKRTHRHEPLHQGWPALPWKPCRQGLDR